MYNYTTENLCRHQTIPLDMDDGDFFDRKLQFIQCKTHGARFRAVTGMCVSGPCKGKALKKLAVEVEEDTSDVYVLPSVVLPPPEPEPELAPRVKRKGKTQTTTDIEPSETENEKVENGSVREERETTTEVKS